MLLHRRGWDVTQSTLSRDLRELRLARVPTPDGVRYTVADGAISSAARPALDALLPQLLTRVDGVGELIVVRTVPGGAQPVASALDGESWPDVLGTVGGDDTILVVCRSSAARERLERRLAQACGDLSAMSRTALRIDGERAHVFIYASHLNSYLLLERS